MKRGSGRAGTPSSAINCIPAIDQTEAVNTINRSIQDKTKKIDTAFLLDRIPIQPPLHIGRVPAVAVVVEAGEEVSFLAGEAVGVRDAAQV